MQRKIAVAVCALALTALTASPALAGEVTGPPGGGGKPTAAPTHAHSLCAFSGLNDFKQGQTGSITQNWGQDIVLGIAGQEGPPPGVGCNPTAAG
jgi:hypothetical protein